MKIAVLGLWHLGAVTAACMAQAGHEVTGWDPDSDALRRVAEGRGPVAEPGLNDLLARTIAAGALRFTSQLPDALRDADIIWVAFDTPVDADDRADVERVVGHVRAALPHVKDGALVVVSSQLPVGTVARLEGDYAALGTARNVSFACCPENLRRGNASQVFTQPERVVAGVRSERDRVTIAKAFAGITARIEWMSVESAEMTKHAINAFLATSVAFINEIAAIGERVGADAKEVERGLKTDSRIGPGAYLKPGAAFAGGTLARDLALLSAKAAEVGVQAPLVRGVEESNRVHSTWIYRTVAAVLAPLAQRRIAVWGLTYKPGTDTLRRSLSVELCRVLARDGAQVAVFDPAVRVLPDDLKDVVHVSADALSAASGADAVIVGTEWPAFREITADALVKAARQPTVIDPGRFLASTAGADSRVRYLAVGTPQR